jgi:hypothetical protein
MRGSAIVRAIKNPKMQDHQWLAASDPIDRHRLNPQYSLLRGSASLDDCAAAKSSYDTVEVALHGHISHRRGEGEVAAGQFDGFADT